MQQQSWSIQLHWVCRAPWKAWGGVAGHSYGTGYGTGYGPPETATAPTALSRMP